MALPDLTTLAAVQAALTRFNLTPGEAAYLPTAIASASGAVRQWLGGQVVTRATYDQVLRPTPDGYVFPRQQPVVAVNRVCAGRTTALTVRNADPATNQWATVAYSVAGDATEEGAATGLVLTRAAAGVVVIDPVPFSALAPPTLAALAAAVVTKGGGWAAAVTPGFASWGAADLNAADVAAQDGMAGAGLDVWGQVLSNVRVRRPGYYLDLNGATPAYTASAAGGYPFFDQAYVAGGDRVVRPSVRVVYDAGFATVPAAVAEATVEAVKLIMERLRVFSLMKSETDGAYSYTLAGPELIEAIPSAVRQQLVYYRVNWVG